MPATTATEPLDVAIIGAGSAGIGVRAAVSELELDVRVFDREAIGASFRAWPEETRLLTPSFPGGFGQTDLNAVTPHTAPAFALVVNIPPARSTPSTSRA